MLIAEVSARPVAAHVYLAWNGAMTAKFSASEESAWRLRPNQLLFWHSIKTACEQGCHSFDFGRTDARNQGLRAFKRSWGAAEEPLAYTVLGARPEPAPAGNGTARQLLGCAIRHGPVILCRAIGEALYRYAALGPARSRGAHLRCAWDEAARSGPRSRSLACRDMRGMILISAASADQSTSPVT